MLQKLIALSALLRLPNLLILAVSVYIYSHRILYPSLVGAGMHGSLRFKDFMLFLFIVMCTGAGGYIHNDILDRNSDAINDKRGIVGGKIKLSIAWSFYWFVVLSPIPFVFSLSSEIHNLNYVYAYIVVVILLFLYNRFLKRLPLVGNLVVAGLCTYVFLLPATIEFTKLQSLKTIDPTIYHKCWLITVSFSFFVFLTHTIREIIKDAEDIEGDKASNFLTLPVVVSSLGLRLILLSLEGILLLGVIYWLVVFPLSPILLLCHLVLLIPMVLWIIYQTYKANVKSHFSELSLQLKYLMLAGLCSLFLINI